MSDFNENNNGENLQPEAPVSIVEPEVAEPVPADQPGFAEAELVAGVEQAKKTPIALIAAVIVIILAAGSAAAYNFIPFVKNNVKMLISKPENYYAWVEEENLKNTADNVSEAYGKVLGSLGKNNEQEIEVKADIDPENVRALIEELTGDPLTDTGITLPSSISLKSGAKTENGNVSGAVKVTADDNSLATVNMYMQDGKYYYQIPDLSSAYIAMDLQTLMNEAMSQAGDNLGSVGADSAMLEGFMDGYMGTITSLTSDPDSIKDMLSEKELNELIVKYFTIVFENVDDVDLTKGVSCEVNGEKVKYNKLSADINQGALFGICKDALKEAKKDRTIIKIVEKFGLTEDKYTSTIDELLDSIGTIEVSGGDTMFTMNVYVNSSGKICGRDIEVPGQDDMTVSLMAAEKGSDELIDVQIMSAGEGIQVSGKSKEKSGKESGDLTVSVNMDGISEEVPVSYKDFEIVNDEKGYCKGEFTIDLTSSVGSSITFNLDSDGKGQTFKTDINVNDTNYGSLSIVTKEKNSLEIPAFDASQKVYNFTTEGTEIQQYIMDVSEALPAFIDNIGSAFGVPGIGQLFGSALVSNANDELTGGITDISDDSLLEDDAQTEQTKYDFSKLSIQVSGQTIPLPAKISGILDLVKVEDTEIDAYGTGYYYNDDYTLGINIKNDTDAPLAPADCTVIGLNTSSNASVPVTVDGFAPGNAIENVATKYGATLSDPSSGFITITDTKSDWNTLTFYYFDGEIDSISISFYEY